jgi:putative Mn2+ efflux pump MntP
MVYDSIREKIDKREEGVKIGTALILAFATSIDALMVGLSFGFLEASIAATVAVIGIVTFLLSLVGFRFGCGIGRVFGKKIKFVGGLILIIIGLRILIEHLL